MGVAAQVLQHLLGPAEWRLGVDHPLGAGRWRQELLEGLRVLQRLHGVEELQHLALERRAQKLEEQATEQPRQHAHRQEEPRRTSHPALAVERDSTSRHNTVQMRMVQQVLAPGVQDGDEADLGPQVLGIGSDRAQGLRRCLEQHVVQQRFVLVGDRLDGLRHREHDVEVFHRQQLGAAILQPLRTRQRLALRAVAVAAAVEGDALMAAGVALLDMPTECRGAAALDRAHHAQLRAAECAGVIATELRADLAKNRRQL